MLSESENERITRVGPGTPMGNVMRRYWLPAVLSSELPENDGTLVQVRLLPPTHRFVSKTFEHCNWLQALEGGLDTAHSSFLHNEKLGDKTQLRRRDGHPRIEVDRAGSGYRYASIRNLGDEETYVRVYHYAMPFQQMRGRITGRSGGPARRRSGDPWQHAAVRQPVTGAMIGTKRFLRSS